MNAVNERVEVKAIREKNRPTMLLVAQIMFAFLSVGPMKSSAIPPTMLPATPVATVTPPNARSAELAAETSPEPKNS